MTSNEPLLNLYDLFKKDPQPRSAEGQPTPSSGDTTSYGAAALRDEAEKVASTPEGARNHTLNTAAFRMGQLIAAGVLNEADTKAALVDAATRCGLSPQEALATIRSGLTAGLTQARTVTLTGPDTPTVGTLEPDPAWSASEAQSVEEVEIRAEVRKLRVRDEARRRFALEQRGELQPFDAGTLAEVLARPPEPPMRVAELMPSDGAVLLSAQRKTGKTTLSANLTRSLLTGEDFLGRFAVRPIAGDVAFLNYEVSAAQLARWLSDVGVPADRCHLVNLRGTRNPLTVEDERARLASHLRERGVEAIIVDPFGRAFGGQSQNDAGEVGRWLIDLDHFVRAEVGAKDLVLTAHAGWNGERTRGSTALEDWADAVWTLTRDTDEEEGARYFRAMGRDVDLDEDRLDFDPQTRRLSLAGAGSRKHSREHRRHDETRREILSLLASHGEGLTGKELATRAGGRRDAAFTRARQSLVDDGSVLAQPRKKGRGGGVMYSLNPNLPNLPKLTDSVSSEPTEPPLYRGRFSSGTFESEPTETKNRSDDCTHDTGTCPNNNCGVFGECVDGL